MNQTVKDSSRVQNTGLGAAALYVLAGAVFLLGLMLLIGSMGCQTTPPTPDGFKFPPVQYPPTSKKPPIPQGTPAFVWNIGEYEPPNKVRIEWTYEPTNMANIVFRVYASYTPDWDTNWVGWWLLGETESLSFSNNLIGDARFFTVTASNTLLCLESDPARRE